MLKLLKKIFPEPEYNKEGTIYDNPGYHMAYHKRA